MTLLDSMPHECTIQRRTRAKGALGGSKDTAVVEQTGVECWEQRASTVELTDFAKRGMSVNTKVFFPSDPGVSSKHQILITKRDGTDVSSPIAFDVMSSDAPDASAGLGVLWRVFIGRKTSQED